MYLLWHKLQVFLQFSLIYCPYRSSVQSLSSYSSQYVIWSTHGNFSEKSRVVFFSLTSLSSYIKLNLNKYLLYESHSICFSYLEIRKNIRTTHVDNTHTWVHSFLSPRGCTSQRTGHLCIWNNPVRAYHGNLWYIELNIFNLLIYKAFFYTLLQNARNIDHKCVLFTWYMHDIYLVPEIGLTVHRVHSSRLVREWSCFIRIPYTRRNAV